MGMGRYPWNKKWRNSYWW